MKFYKNQYVTISRSRGFTLIEIIVVVAILAILATAVVPKIMDKPQEANIALAKQHIQTLDFALDMYKVDNYSYPSTEQGLEALVKKPDGDLKRYKKGGYMKRGKLPKDPWGNAYQYQSPGANGEVDIFSLGPDKQPSDDDIGNWNLDK